MKKQILATLVLVISVFATATAGSKGETDCSSSNQITLHTGFSKIIVDGNVDVVLFEDNSQLEIRTFGNNDAMAATSISQKDGVLTITNNRTKGEKVLVYVPVNQLSIIEAKGNSKVSSAAVLLSQQLTLVVKGDCKFDIRSTGNIDVVQDAEVEMLVEKRLTSSKPAAQS
ncbi:MAG: DUF2807 domain-containing protein [Chitinophagaceae bacterium]|nr:DUF2807 domain-containing protein [Chitinophagaceae bacterium]